MLFHGKNIKYKDVLDIEQFMIEKKHITVLLGESGGGKTTFLKLLNKLISPTEGSIHYLDEPLETRDAIALRKEVILLQQTPYVFKNTVLDNFEMIANYHDLSIDETKIKTLLDDVGLSKSLNDDVANFSGGEKQRLALARLLYCHAEVILLDEPSSALDEETEKLVIKKIVNYVKENHKSLVMITHSSAIARTYADKIIRIEKGRIKEVIDNE